MRGEDVHGKPARAEVLAALPPTSRARFADRIVVSDWYPLSEHLVLYGAVRDTLYGTNPSAGLELGRRLARRRLDIFSRMFLRLRDPAFIHVGFADEPVAAALGYGLSLASPRTVLVVDFGGGTLHIALVAPSPPTRRGNCYLTE